MRQVLCLASVPWQTVPQRTQQLMARLRDTEVLYCEPDDGKKGWKRPGRRVRPGVVACTLPPVDPEGSRRRLLRRDPANAARYIQEQLAHYHFREPVLWCADSSGARYLDQLAYRGLVYDCDRDWPEYPVQWESDLAMAADVCFAASPDLADHLKPCCGNVVLLPNGCNYPMFAHDELPVPDALRPLPRPILGYEGTLWADLDLGPLLKTALSHAEYQIVLLGEAEDNPQLPELLALPNVHHLGFIPPVDLPDHLCALDVCLSLTRRGHMDDDVVSPRMYEYLSTGKPLVAMLRPGQVEDFPDVVYGAHTPAEFSVLCARALEETGTLARDRRRAYGEAAAWSARAARASDILENIGLF